MQRDSKAGGLAGVRDPRFSAEIGAELFNRAEKELAAFVAAVNGLHGEEQARAVADDWLLELIALKAPYKGASLNLRSVTIRAAVRLARRLSMPWPAHPILAVIAGILLLIAPANAHSNSRHSLTRNKPANSVVIRWNSVSAKHEFQKDSYHPSRNPHKSAPDMHFNHSCEEVSSSVGTNST